MEGKPYSSQEYKEQVVMEPSCGYPSAFAGSYRSLILSSARDLFSLRIKGAFLDTLQEVLRINTEDLADIFGISRSKYYRLLKEHKLDPSSVDVLSAFLKLWNKGLIAFDGDDDAFRSWLKTSNYNLGDIQPLELMKTETGRREVEAAILRIEYSIYG